MQQSSWSHANNLRTAFSGIKKEGITRTRISKAIIMPIDMEKNVYRSLPVPEEQSLMATSKTLLTFELH
jgi:hypothetical protein